MKILLSEQLGVPEAGPALPEAEFHRQRVTVTAALRTSYRRCARVHCLRAGRMRTSPTVRQADNTSERRNPSRLERTRTTVRPAPSSAVSTPEAVRLVEVVLARRPVEEPDERVHDPSRHLHRLSPGRTMLPGESCET